MLDLTWIKDKRLIEQTGESSWTIKPIDHIGIDDALGFIQRVNKMENLHCADKTASLSRYSRIGLTITPAYLSLRGSNKGKRRRVHPLGLIQYLTAAILINGNMFTGSGSLVECAKARESDVFYGSLCLYVNELENLRAVLSLDNRDKLNITKIFDSDLVQRLPQFTMETDIPMFGKLRDIYIDKCIRPIYTDTTDVYTAFWEMMYYRTFAGCLDRYMRDVLALAGG